MIPLDRSEGLLRFAKGLEAFTGMGTGTGGGEGRKEAVGGRGEEGKDGAGVGVRKGFVDGEKERRKEEGQGGLKASNEEHEGNMGEAVRGDLTARCWRGVFVSTPLGYTYIDVTKLTRSRTLQFP